MKRSRLKNSLAILLIAAAAAALLFLAERYKWEADWTYGNRNFLTDASRQVLDAMPGTIEFTAYVAPGPERQSIRNRIERYRRYRGDIGLTFVDPAKNPPKMRELGLDDGQTRISYRSRGRTLTDLTEQTITGVLQQLSAAGGQWILFLAGHGERDPGDDGRGGYSRLARELAGQGLKTLTLNLAETPRIPDNASVLVIAGPRQTPLPGEVEIIRDYVAAGGNLLWLSDPDRPAELAPLATELGIRWLDGTVIYPDYRELGLRHPAIALVAGYPPHPITERLSGITLFPFAGGLEQASTTWRAKLLLRTPARSWLETGSLENREIAFDEDEDSAGPVAMGLALTRPARNGREAGTDRQRVVAIADSDFLANGYIGNVGNMDLGVSLLQWLGHRDPRISVRVPPAPDSSLRLAPWQSRGIWYLYVIVLPAALLLTGLGRWWWRRRR